MKKQRPPAENSYNLNLFFLTAKYCLKTTKSYSTYSRGEKDTRGIVKYLVVNLN